MLKKLIELLIIAMILNSNFISAEPKAIKSVPINPSILTSQVKLLSGSRKTVGLEWTPPISFDVMHGDFFFLRKEGVIVKLNSKGKFKGLIITHTAAPIDMVVFSKFIILLTQNGVKSIDFKGNLIDSVSFPDNTEDTILFKFFTYNSNLMVGDTTSEQLFTVKVSKLGKLNLIPFQSKLIKPIIPHKKNEYVLVDPILSKNFNKTYFFIVKSNTEIPSLSAVVEANGRKILTKTEVPSYPGYDCARWIVVDKTGVVWTLTNHLGELKLEGF